MSNRNSYKLKNTKEKEINDLYNSILSTLANKVNTTRKLQKISIRKLCKLSGVSTTVISDLENERYLPKLEGMLRLLYALNIPLSDFGVVVQAYNKDTDLNSCLTKLGLNKVDKTSVLKYVEYLKNKKR